MAGVGDSTYLVDHKQKKSDSRWKVQDTWRKEEETKREGQAGSSR